MYPLYWYQWWQYRLITEFLSSFFSSFFHFDKISLATTKIINKVIHEVELICFDCL